MKTFSNLIEFNQYAGLATPLDNDFDIQRIDFEDHELFALPMQSFSHKFYAIGSYENLAIEINAGFSKFQSHGPFIFIKTPKQIVSWSIKPGIMKGWNLMFTGQYLMKHKLLATVIRDFPFLQIDNALPFDITDVDIEQLNLVHKNIYEEYHSIKPDRFEMISSHLYTLLLMLKRIYSPEKTIFGRDADLGKDYDRLLYQKYMSLLEQESDESENCDNCSVKYFADKLAVHPNYLNAAVKRVTGYTALYFIQERIINLAKTFLLQSNLSIKEISYELCFHEPTHFGAFFKKYTGITPTQFRRQSQS